MWHFISKKNKMVVLKQYNETYWSLINVNEKIYIKKNKSPLKNFNNKYSEEETERISLSRTKRRIREICLSNDFEYFVTMTVSSKIKQYDRTDLENCIDNIKKIMKKVKRVSTAQGGDFKYIFIAEQHKNGAYHFHGMMRDLPKGDIYTNKYGYLSSHIIDTLGYNSFSKINSYNKCCNYISKYITKNCCRTERNQVYFCSRGLDKPKEEVMIDTDLTKIFINVYQNEYIQKKDFDISRLSEKEKYMLSRYFEQNDLFFEKNKNITNWLKLFTNFNRFDNIRIYK